MKRFLKTLLLFSIPILIFSLPPLKVLYSTGELYKNADAVIALEQKYVLGYASNDDYHRNLKWKYLKSKPKKDVVALGSSRVLQFRAEMFDSSFYNAGYIISSLSEYVPFLESIPKEKLPQYLIISLDQWLFNSDYDPLNKKKEKIEEKWTVPSKNFYHLKLFIRIWKDLLSKTYNVWNIDRDQEIKRFGMYATIFDYGYRNDGSFDYGIEIVRHLTNDTIMNDYNFKDTQRKLTEGTEFFQFGDKVNPLALVELDKILRYCKENNIVLIGFLPPISDKVNHWLSTSGKHSYIPKIYPEALAYFEKYNFELYDFTHLKNIQSSDDEALDGYHGSEVAYLRLLLKMLENNSALNNTTDIERLKTDLKNRMNDFEVYGD
jgi:hypothetical protein